jgi:hypothetical protein
MPNGSMTTAMYQHIIVWSRSLYRETRKYAILCGNRLKAAEIAEIRRSDG